MDAKAIVCEICGGSGVIYPAVDRNRARMCPQCDGTGFVPDADELTALREQLARVTGERDTAIEAMHTLQDARNEFAQRLTRAEAALKPFAEAWLDYQEYQVSGGEYTWLEWMAAHFDNELSAACYERVAALDSGEGE